MQRAAEHDASRIRARRRLLLIGQAPSRTSDPTRPFSSAGRSGRRLIALSGLSEEEFFARVQAINLVDQWPGRKANGHGDAFPPLTDKDVWFRLDASRRVILVGRAVAHRLLGGKGSVMPYLRWEAGVAILPHPSGLNYWWNDPSHVRAAKRFLRAALRQ